MLKALPEDDDRRELGDAFARVLARCAVIAVAAGDITTARDWLRAANEVAHDDEHKPVLETAQHDPERYRMLAHGRYLVAHDREGAARKLWKQVMRGSNDSLATAARLEQQAPRPLNGNLPTLSRVNGIGAAFYGSRDHSRDGSYVTTHCISLVFVPVFPLGAYRVRDAGHNAYTIMAREQLSSFAKLTRLLVPSAIAVCIAGFAISSYINDPARKARNQFAEVIDSADSGAPDAALARLDAELKSGDIYSVPAATASRAGAAVIRLTAGYVPHPFTRDNLDQANRVVRRYQDLPDAAKGGESLDTLLGALDGWVDALKGADDHEARLALLRLESTVAVGERATKVKERASAERIAVAEAKAAKAPLDALALLVEDPTDAAAIERAEPIVVKLDESPALLDEAGADLDAWLAARPGGYDEVRAHAAKLRDDARVLRTETEADTQTKASLAKLDKQHPGDQRIAVALARLDFEAGNLDAADARLRKLGEPGWLVRDARFLLAKIATGQDKLDVADDMLSALLAPRLQGFVAASGALEAAVKKIQDRIEDQMRTGMVPEDLRRRVEAAPESEQGEIVGTWARDQVENDPGVKTRREAYMAYADVVPMSIAAGTVKLRRAQKATGPARENLLADAEKTFLAVKTQAEGQPEYQLGLGEIYARLGKTKESDAAFQSVLDKHEPELTIQVANVYRNIGAVARAKQIATELFETATGPMKDSTAVLLALLAAQNDDDQAEEESWLRKADQKQPFVKTSLIEIEGHRLMRAGKNAECDRKFAEAAALHLKTADGQHTAGYNNAAIADRDRFLCSGDLAALADAEKAQGQAYRAQGDDPIVVGNYAGLVQDLAIMRVLAKRVDIRTLRPSSEDARGLVEKLLESSERDAVLAELVADAGWRRAAELYEHAEVLAPSNTLMYEEEAWRAAMLRDANATAAVLDRLRHAKALDTSEADARWQHWMAGESDARWKTQLATESTRYATVLQGKLDPHTRAFALYLHASDSYAMATLFGTAEDVAKSRAERTEAAQLWPALRADGALAAYAIDEIALGLDADKWHKLRHERSTVGALAQLVDTGEPFAVKIRGAAQWAEVGAAARADTTRPGLDDVRLARLLGDAAVETHAKAVFEDKLARAAIELHSIIDPSNPAGHEDLAYFDRH